MMMFRRKLATDRHTKATEKTGIRTLVKKVKLEANWPASIVYCVTLLVSCLGTPRRHFQDKLASPKFASGDSPDKLQDKH